MTAVIRILTAVMSSSYLDRLFQRGRSFAQLVFDTAHGPFTKLSAGLVVWGGVFLGVGIPLFAVRHQQYKHGE